jgi:hypothetical protein
MSQIARQPHINEQEAAMGRSRVISAVAVAALSSLGLTIPAGAQDIAPREQSNSVELQVDIAHAAGTSDASLRNSPRLLRAVASGTHSAGAREALLSNSVPDARVYLVRRTAALQAAAQPRRNWVARHPVIVGAVAGFGTGFLVGYLPGDDGVFDDFTAGFNGWVVGGIGAGIGASIGALFRS